MPDVPTAVETAERAAGGEEIFRAEALRHLQSPRSAIRTLRAPSPWTARGYWGLLALCAALVVASLVVELELRASGVAVITQGPQGPELIATFPPGARQGLSVGTRLEVDLPGVRDVTVRERLPGESEVRVRARFRASHLPRGARARASVRLGEARFLQVLVPGLGTLLGGL